MKFLVDERTGFVVAKGPKGAGCEAKFEQDMETV